MKEDDLKTRVKNLLQGNLKNKPLKNIKNDKWTATLNLEFVLQ
jgi:hypothetical protein